VATGDELRAAMRRFPAGIAVLTLPRPFGVTIGSLASLSLEPPLVGVAIGRDTQAHELIRDYGGFALSLLASGQQSIAQHFARNVPPIAQWERIDAREGARGPLLEGAAAWLDCAVRAEHDAGDHTYFIADVERIELGSATRGVLYVDGSYE
jgi:flavin reductase (DIM6/NTAB) family NADH-FMN oxidoreductase RutF